MAVPFHLSVFLPGIIISLLLNFNSLSLIYILNDLCSLNQQSAAFSTGPGVKEFTPINGIFAIIHKMPLVLCCPWGWALPELLWAGFSCLGNIQGLVPSYLGSALEILPWISPWQRMLCVRGGERQGLAGCPSGMGTELNLCCSQWPWDLYKCLFPAWPWKKESAFFCSHS